MNHGNLYCTLWDTYRTIIINLSIIGQDLVGPFPHYIKVTITKSCLVITKYTNISWEKYLIDIIDFAYNTSINLDCLWIGKVVDSICREVHFNVTACVCGQRISIISQTARKKAKDDYFYAPQSVVDIRSWTENGIRCDTFWRTSDCNNK